MYLSSIVIAYTVSSLFRYGYIVAAAISRIIFAQGEKERKRSSILTSEFIYYYNISSHYYQKRYLFVIVGGTEARGRN